MSEEAANEFRRLYGSLIEGADRIAERIYEVGLDDEALVGRRVSMELDPTAAAEVAAILRDKMEAQIAADIAALEAKRDAQVAGFNAAIAYLTGVLE